MPTEWKEQTRVRVHIGEEQRTRWAQGAADALHGMVGTIERVRKDDPLGFGNVLVQFDAPAPTWHAYQSPVTGHWFAADEIRGLTFTRELGEPAPDCACNRGSTCDVNHDPAACGCGRCS